MAKVIVLKDYKKKDTLEKYVKPIFDLTIKINPGKAFITCPSKEKEHGRKL